MLKKVSVIISFPQGAYFNDNLIMLVYSGFLNFIKDLSCVRINTKCLECTEKKLCRYHEITGNNFKMNPGIMMKMDLFEKRKYVPNEQKIIDFYLIGNQEKYADYISLYFDNLQQKLYGNFFYIKDIKKTELSNEASECNHIKVLSPIHNLSFVEEYNEMVQYYNSSYLSDFKMLETTDKVINEKSVSLNSFRCKTKHIKAKGVIGDFILSDKVKLDRRLIEIGIGKYNYLGGGKSAIESDH